MNEKPTKQHYTDADKLEVVQAYLALGKVPMVEAVTGVNRHTIRQWKLQPWWTEMVSQIQTESNQELDTKLTKIIDRSLDTISDQIENGEFIFDPKTGSVKRIPVRFRDVQRTAVDLLDKRDILRERPAVEKAEQQTVDVLHKLAGQFASWVKANMKEPKIVEGEVIALHEEREAGLQDRVQQVPQPESPENPQGDAERSPQGV